MQIKSAPPRATVLDGAKRSEVACIHRGAARLAVADLKIDPFNRAALYKYEA